MARKKGVCFLLLLLACAALAGHFEDRKEFQVVKTLMKNCREKGYEPPTMSQLQSIFKSSDNPLEDGDNNNQPKTFPQAFLTTLHFATDEKKKAGLAQLPEEFPGPMTDKMWLCSGLPAVVRKMRNSSESSACYLRAFMAPLSFAAVTTLCDDLDSNDFEALLWSARLMLPGHHFLNLTSKMKDQNIDVMMKTLQGFLNSSSDYQKEQVARWTKQQILRNKFNCTTMAMSNSSSGKGHHDHCGSQAKWLDVQEFKRFGDLVSHFDSEDLKAFPINSMCELFSIGWFKSFKAKPKPSWAKKFLDGYKSCFPGDKFQENLDRLGRLACHLEDDSFSKPNISVALHLLNSLNDCNNHTKNKRMRQVIDFIVSNVSNALQLQELHENIRFLSQKWIPALPPYFLSKVLKNSTLRWTPGQECILARTQKAHKCEKMSMNNLTALQSIVHGLPICIFKKIAGQFLEDIDAYEDMCETMTGGQQQAVMKKVGPPLLMKHLPKCLPCLASLRILQNESVDSLDEVENKTWCITQAAYWAKKTEGKLPVFGKLRSTIQGVRCRWIEKLKESPLVEWIKAITDNPQWLSKAQARCSAHAFFITLMKKRRDYFKTISEQELEEIPPKLLLYLWPSKVRELPDSVCAVLIEKMEQVDLSSVHPRERSRRALVDKVLHCKANGGEMTVDDVNRFGPLLCEQSAVNLKLMGREVLKFTLQMMAGCRNIPEDHKAELLQLIKENFGDPSSWKQEMMEKFGLFVLMDEETLSKLPNTLWLKKVIYFYNERLRSDSEALKKKIFELVTNISLSAGASESQPGVVPTELMIEELGASNCYWPPASLELISDSMFENTVEKLGECPSYTADQLAVLTRKAEEIFAPLSDMDPCQLVQLGCIAQGFSLSDLEVLPFTLNSLKGKAHCSWTEPQMEALWKGVAKRENLTAQMLDAADIVELDRFIAGLSANEIANISVENFREAVGRLSCFALSNVKKQQLRSLAIAAAGGEPSTWSAAQVSDLASILPHLNSTDCASLQEDATTFLKASCIPLISQLCLSRFSLDQLRALGPDNAVMVTRSQRAVLSIRQLTALDEAETGPEDVTRNSDDSGAPSLSVEGALALMKPLLFLLMGFLLL